MKRSLGNTISKEYIDIYAPRSENLPPCSVLQATPDKK